MNEVLTLNHFFELQSRELALKWVAGKNSGERVFSKSQDDLKTSIVGYFNLIHSTQVQILGETEVRFLQSLSPQEQQNNLKRLFGQDTIVVIIAEGYQPLEDMRTMADDNNIGLFQTTLLGEQLVYNLSYYFSQFFAEKISLHGVFMEVLSIGVLLTGSSGIGKSELALELITRGHRLIADDAPLFARIAPDIIIGTSPPVIQDFLEVRGLGVINIRRMYGDTAVKLSKYLKLIISIQESKRELNQGDRLATPEKTRTVLGMEIPMVDILVAPGRNVSVLVEAAVRNHLVRTSKYYADKDIMARQVREMNKQ